MRTARAGSGGRPRRKPLVAGVCGTLPLFGQSGALRFEPALLGTESPTGTGLLAVDLARLEDETARPLDWLGRSSKTSTSTRWSPTPSSSYAADLRGKQTQLKQGKQAEKNSCEEGDQAGEG